MVEAERFRPAPGRHAGVGARVHGGAHQVRASAGKQWACACRTGAPSWPCHRRLMAACFFGFFLRSNVGIEKNTSAQTVKQSNAGGGTRSIGACTQLLYWLHALDCLSRSTLTRPGNQGGEHRSFGRRGAPWHPGDACTPGQATRERGGAGYLCELLRRRRRCAVGDDALWVRGKRFATQPTLMYSRFTVFECFTDFWRCTVKNN